MNEPKILIIEDEAPLRETLTDLLEINGFNVSFAENGKEGVKMILETNPDLVICDVNMPEMNGFEVLQAVNGTVAPEIAPSFLFVTARAQLKDFKQGMMLGADDYITKPFVSTELLSVIRLRLEKRSKLLKQQNNANSSNAPIQEIKKIALPTGDGLRYLDLTDIVKCEADRSYCIFYTKKKERLVVSKPMKEFEPILTQNGFLRVHKSHIVNMSFANTYVRGEGGYLTLDDGSHVSVSARKKEELMNFFKST